MVQTEWDRVKQTQVRENLPTVVSGIGVFAPIEVQRCCTI